MIIRPNGHNPNRSPRLVRTLTSPAGVFIHLGDFDKMLRDDRLIAEASTMLIEAQKQGDSNLEGMRNLIRYLLGIGLGKIPSNPELVDPLTFAKLSFARNKIAQLPAQPHATPTAQDNVAPNPSPAPELPRLRGDGNQPGDGQDNRTGNP